MPRKREIAKRYIDPDPRHGDTLVAKLINILMYDGKKQVAERILYGAFDQIGDKTGDEPVRVFKKAVDNVKPQLEVKSRRVGGSNYQVPIEVRPERRTALALRWIVDFARNRSEKSMVDRLANEVLDASNNRGSAVKKKEDTHRMADANKAFAHYRW
ncbi:MAG: 30S ribosomal protein S7 [Myxococcota bacterium]